MAASAEGLTLHALEEEVGHLSIELSRESLTAYDKAIESCPWLAETSPRTFFSLRPFHEDARVIVARRLGFRCWSDLLWNRSLESWRAGELSTADLILSNPVKAAEFLPSEDSVANSWEIRALKCFSALGEHSEELSWPLVSAYLATTSCESNQALEALSTLAGCLGVDSPGAQEALEAAAGAGLEVACRTLLAKGVEPTAGALALACWGGWTETVEAMLEAGLEPSSEAFSIACRYSRWQTAALFIRDGRLKGQKIEGTSGLCSILSRNAPAWVLKLAIEAGWQEDPQKLWDATVSLHRPDLEEALAETVVRCSPRAESVFLGLCAAGNAESAKEKALADPHLCSNLTTIDKSMLCLWADAGMSEALALALECGCPADSPNAFGAHPLHFAAFRGCPTCVKHLLDHAASVNQTDGRHHSTPLGWCLYGAIHLGQPLGPEDAPGADHLACAQALKAAGAVILPSYLERTPTWLADSLTG